MQDMENMGEMDWSKLSLHAKQSRRSSL